MQKEKEQTNKVEPEQGKKPPEQKKKTPWINAWSNKMQGRQAYSNCIEFIDCKGIGEANLAIADHYQKLVVFKGINIEFECQINGIPNAIKGFYPFSGEKNAIPVLAIATPSGIYMYKNYKPYFSINIPPEELPPVEKQIWNT